MWRVFCCFNRNWENTRQGWNCKVMTELGCSELSFIHWYIQKKIASIPLNKTGKIESTTSYPSSCICHSFIFFLVSYVAIKSVPIHEEMDTDANIIRMLNHISSIAQAFWYGASVTNTTWYPCYDTIPIVICFQCLNYSVIAVFGTVTARVVMKWVFKIGFLGLYCPRMSCGKGLSI